MDDDTTLQQGLEAFRSKNEKYFGQRNYSKEAQEFLLCHDIAHVVFGCDTTIFGEGVVKTWTTFGTTLNFWKITRGYNEVNALQLFKMYSFGHVIKNIWRFLSVIPKTIVRAKKMSKPWPFSNYTEYLNVPVSQIRKEFNIKVIA